MSACSMSASEGFHARHARVGQLIRPGEEDFIARWKSLEILRLDNLDENPIFKDSQLQNIFPRNAWKYARLFSISPVPPFLFQVMTAVSRVGLSPARSCMPRNSIPDEILHLSLLHRVVMSTILTLARTHTRASLLDTVIPAGGPLARRRRLRTLPSFHRRSGI